MNVGQFLDKWKKGSRPFRKIICNQSIDQIPHNIVKYADTVDTVINLTKAKHLCGSWNISFLDNQMRTFLFKLYNNTLGLNYRVTHFNPNVEPFCTFCTILGVENLERETPRHLFLECLAVEQIYENFFRITLGLVEWRAADYLTYPQLTDSPTEQFLFIISSLVKVYIWNCKLRHQVPVQDNLENFIITECKLAMLINNRFFTLFHSLEPGLLNNFFFRDIRQDGE